MTHKFKLPLLLLLFSVLISACGDQKDQTEDAQQPEQATSKPAKSSTGEASISKTYRWIDYIESNSHGIISSQSKISILFRSPVIDVAKVGDSAENFLKITPPIEGSLTFVTPRQIELIPSGPLPSGQRYSAALNTSQLEGFPDGLKNYQFSFSVIKQAFEIHSNGVKADDNGDTVSVSGYVATADSEDGLKVEKMLSASFLNKPAQIQWQHAENGRRHEFIVPGLKRQKQTEKLLLNWNGALISVDDQGKRSFEIPAYGEFKVANIRAVQADRQLIEISFTEKLSAEQNLKGLIQIDRGRFTIRQQGSLVKIYPQSLFTGEVTITIDQGLKNSRGFKLGEPVQQTLTFFNQKPQVRFVGKGVILPPNKSLTIPFEAVNVDSVQVTAFKIYANNMGQFLQANNLDQNYQSQRVGRYLWRKSISLESPVQDNWNRYSLDISELLAKHPGALFRLTLSINRSNSTYSCSQEENNVPVIKERAFSSYDQESYNEYSNWDYADNYYNNTQLRWRDRNNPCKDAYYRYGKNIEASRNFLASNIGIVAKQGNDRKLTLVTTNISTGLPWSQVKLEVYNYQHQQLAQATSDKNGLADIQLDSAAYYVRASVGEETGYLKLSPGLALPTSHFDVGGVKVKQGIKGYLYGERGVWRPGDDIFLTFVLQDKNNNIPPGHPVTLEFFNPKGQLVSSQTNNQPVDDFYRFNLKTEENAITGNWKAIARLGGLRFHKVIKVEAVIPNRLKVELKAEAPFLTASKMPVTTELFSQWLHGAKASNLKADVKVRLLPKKTRFKNFAGFNFDDPAREFRGEKQDVFSGNLDEEGRVSFKTNLAVKGKSPGLLSARFTSRVFEDSGAFSTERQSMDFHPYDNYLGVKLPKGDSRRNMLLTDTPHKIQIASVSSSGEKVALDEVEISLYKINWKWWWDKSGDSLAKYASAYSTEALERTAITTKDGIGEWEMEVNYPAWGRYLVRACDKKGGHCTGEVFYIDWPGWAGRSQNQKGIGASVVNLSTDKDKYQVGDVATINFPPSKQGKVLVSVENGSRLLDRFWTDIDPNNPGIKLPLTQAMSPNVYVSVMLIQPHSGKDNDLPIRLFGVVPVIVDDPATALSPQLQVADEISPQSSADIKVSESNGKSMTYTLAIVDEGLLGLTRYQTPKLRSHFYRKEALGVKTWDLFDEVVGAYGGELDRILALGGDGKEKDGEDGGKKKRFPPVVRFLGPFHLNAGETNSHAVDIPQYLGAVRVMVVAGYEGAYGSTEKSVYVRQPVNVLATVPRVVGPEEIVTIPVAVFVNEQALGEVSLEIEHDDHFERLDKGPIKLNFSEPGDQLGFIPLKVNSTLGQAHLRFVASNKNHTSQQDIYVDVRSANPVTSRQTKKVLKAGESWNTTHQPHGLPSTNQLTLELSRVPPLNLESRLKYLIRYPHGCVEQTTSSIFPQLYLNDLMTLEKTQADQVENNVAIGIERLRGFQLPSGGFAYWPGQNKIHDWASSYVGHFLLEAKSKGYHIPYNVLSNWIGYQRRTADSWTSGDTLSQSYRLFTLAMAGKPALGAMNRLRERDQIDNVSQWYLAAAYQKVGQTDAAKQLVAGLSTQVKSYARAGNTFGSSLRDQAIILDSLVLMNDQVLAEKMVQQISQTLSSTYWLSTQSTAYALNSMSHYVFQSDVGKQEAITAAYKIGDAPIEIVNNRLPLWKKHLTESKDEQIPVEINNQSGGKLYVTLHAEGVPPAGKEEAEQQGLAIQVDYFSASGKPVDVTRLAQGEDIQIRVKIRNDTTRDFQNLALSQILPSGWEIHNKRFDSLQNDKPEPSSHRYRGVSKRQQNQTAGFDYQDIRDDRVFTYFDLKTNQSKTFNITVNAAYLGRFYLPSFKVEAMYDASKYAKSKGQWVEVVKQP
ncbi:alpha-2-macroglobulin family protein [Aliikangiella coralliicola]|uniref:Alpha-2-macroglobulin n=1 Tax=Aliikangiella coralliicola TaxID=2592383 RepID=A0A545UG65_9GAMM|nr:MG2 domain-containing protein [Aliikangiella coralliicola]TQV88393.1 hypothetical protein FLL46_07680 [Aliikangiella coralliicola]